MITIREAKFSDIEGILPIWKQMMELHDPMDEKYYRRVPHGPTLMKKFLRFHIRKADSEVIVAASPNQIVGYALAYVQANPPVFTRRRYGYLSDLAIREGFLGRGIGKRLVHEIKTWMLSKNLHYVELKVHSKNSGAIASYKKMGFQEGHKLMRQLL